MATKGDAMADMITPHIATKGLSRHFGGLIAVNTIDFEVPKGEIRAIIGPNGAGKSTFVGMLMRTHCPHLWRDCV